MRRLAVVCLLLALLSALPLPGRAQSGRVRQPRQDSRAADQSQPQSSTEPARDSSGIRSGPVGPADNSAPAAKGSAPGRGEGSVPRRGRSRSGQAAKTSGQPAEPNSAGRTSTADPESDADVATSDDVITLDATLVTIPLIVSDRGGRYLPNLTKEDFALYEDSVKQQIAFFSSEEVPFHVALLLDKSGSTNESEYDIKQAATTFVEQLHRDDKVMVVSFGSDVTVENEFTSNRRVLARAIDDIRWGGSTQLYDAVYNTVTQRLKNVEGRKAIILLTDGKDTSSKDASYHEAITAAVESGALVYVVRYPSTDFVTGQPPVNSPFPIPWPGPWPSPRRQPRDWPDPNDRRDRRDPNDRDRRRRRDRWPWLFFQQGAALGYAPQGPRPRTEQRMGRGDFLSDLVDESGGDMFHAARYTDLEPMLRGVAEELRHVYTIGYYPSNPTADGRYRRLRIQVVGNPNVAVRYKRGYNAPRQQFAVTH